jgi:hexosaminidase
MLNGISVRLSVAILLGGAVSAFSESSGHDLMPAPAHFEGRAGVLPIDASFQFGISGPADPRVPAALGRLGAWLQGDAKVAKAPEIGGAGAAFQIEWTGPSLPVQSVGEDEAYVLEVGTKAGRLSAATPLGVLRGLETLRQLVRVQQGQAVVPAVRIEDRPRFPWRGLLIDPCRRWQPVEVIKRTLDGMAAVKLNVLHWHLSEDQGFRLESQAFPALHQKGSDGLFYTVAQVREILEYARARGIRVVPEFDMPGHTTSWLVGHPELGSAPGPFQLVRKWGIFDNNFDPTSEPVYMFLDTFLGEVARLFPDEYLHIGGDEVTPKQWNENAKIQEFMYRNGQRDAHDLQAYFNKRVSEIVTRHKKKMVGWDEILRPDLPKSIVVQSWRGAAALAQSAREGYDGLLSAGFYLDHMKPAAFHYAVDPLPPGSDLTPEQRAHVLGGEACMWSEFVSSENIDSRVWPRAAAIAERLWSPASMRDADDMYRRLDRQSERLEAFGLTHRSSYLPMLKRLVGDRPVEPLKVLADVVEPVKEYGRLGRRNYTSATPMTRLVDAVRPESETVRRFRRDAETWLVEHGDVGPLRRSLTMWAQNHATLEPSVLGAPDSAEIRSLSKDLAALATLGNEALDLLSEGRLRDPAWPPASQRQLDDVSAVRAELELALVPVVRKLVLAAASQDKLRDMPRREWSAWLDKELAARAPRAREH